MGKNRLFSRWGCQLVLHRANYKLMSLSQTANQNVKKETLKHLEVNMKKIDPHSEISGKPHSSGFFGELEKGGKERNKMF